MKLIQLLVGCLMLTFDGWDVGGYFALVIVGTTCCVTVLRLDKLLKYEEMIKLWCYDFFTYFK